MVRTDEVRDRRNRGDDQGRQEAGAAIEQPATDPVAGKDQDGKEEQLDGHRWDDLFRPCGQLEESCNRRQERRSPALPLEPAPQADYPFGVQRVVQVERVPQVSSFIDVDWKALPKTKEPPQVNRAESDHERAEGHSPSPSPHCPVDDCSYNRREDSGRDLSAASEARCGSRVQIQWQRVALF